MDIKLQQNHSFIASSASNPCFSRKPIRIHFFCRKVVDINQLLCSWGSPRKRVRMRHGLLEYDKNTHCGRWVEFRKYRPAFCKPRRQGDFSLLASSDDGVTVNGTSQSSPGSDVEEMRIKLDQSLQGEDCSDGLIQSLHDAARVFELGLIKQISLLKSSWFSAAWLGVDKNAWVKSLSYQAALYSFLQAASEISSRGDQRDRDINVFVQRSLLRQCAPLENLIKDELSAKQPEAYEWFWSDQLPMVVTTFVNYFERDPRFIAATSIYGKGLKLAAGCSSDISLLMLALTCVAAITKLGPAKVSCPQFFSLIPDETGRLMDMLVDFVPIRQAYYSIKDIGLRREFLVHFGPRAASSRVNDKGAEELAFWVEIIQQQLQRAIDREKIWSKLTTSESIEVLEKDLAIFGFFIALGRSTQSFLFENNFDVLDDPLESFIRYLIGGSVLYYPQLSSISSYQLYVEVVCEELEWLPFYPIEEGAVKRCRSHTSKAKGPPNAAAVPQVLDVSSYWMQSFIKYSKWLENPTNIKSAAFLSRGHNKLRACTEELGVLKNRMEENVVGNQRTVSGNYSQTKKELDSFDEALENVEEAVKRLEQLLQELHVSSSDHGKEHLKAACSDLERIRKLKKEAEFLEASFRAKAASLQQEEVKNSSQYFKRKNEISDNVEGSVRDGTQADRVVDNPRGLWSMLVPERKTESGSLEGESLGQAAVSSTGDIDSDSNEIRRFEILRNELIELENRVQRSSQQSENEEDVAGSGSMVTYAKAADGGLVQVQKKESFIGKSIDKMKEAGTDVWQGTQLLAIDTSTAMGLLQRVLTGDELTVKESKALRRTVTDLASVIPIGILMLLPVTAVGHAAMLAAIKRYVPSLIPSTYGPERLDLLRKLEKVKEMERNEVKPNDNVKVDSLMSSDNL
ncbi:uncharacterized protein LOC113338377 isoform X1 [Papaver somniferum]|uniref:uncharacterized protein LOC113338377 isoform X1 n=1 Tax=Papaver somniferum TaxID=3469 RepID=UPI000E6FA444|nr:uncharacterized protein LOC113338377 isoform X1 [Papaver somniferum]